MRKGERCVLVVIVREREDEESEGLEHESWSLRGLEDGILKK